uniref:Uncharacterized protein n=1 Tax=Myoviridae sp. ctitt1 TaxID=2825157 RepID=A0A8S5QJS4_9CAUD|nr:MAG TPA: hypothetical protein [Myoviridae sp. ctitt1]
MFRRPVNANCCARGVPRVWIQCSVCAAPQERGRRCWGVASARQLIDASHRAANGSISL